MRAYEIMVHLMEARNLISADSNGKSDPYVEFKLKDMKKVSYKSKTKKKTLKPVYDEKFSITVTDIEFVLQVTMKDWDFLGKDDFLGNFELTMNDIGSKNELQDKWFALKGVKSGELHMKIGVFDKELALEGGTILSQSKFFRSVNANLQREYILVLDKSFSMTNVDSGEKKTRWEIAKGVCKKLAKFVCKADKDGVSFYLFGDKYSKFEHINDREKIKDIFSKESANGFGTNLTSVLEAVFSEHFNKGKKTTVLVITDGAPDNKETVKHEIVSASNKLTSDDELSITFIQIGEDDGANDFLETLDTGLECKFDIVDSISRKKFKGMSFAALIEKSING